MDNGVKTNLLDIFTFADDVVVNRDGSTGRLPVVALATQLVGSGPVAEALSERATTEDVAILQEAIAADIANLENVVFTAAKFFETVPAGVAGTAVGEQFQVVSGLEVIRYRHETGGATTIVSRTASATAVQVVSARSPGYIVAPTLDHALARVLAVEIYASVGGVAIALPTSLCVREIARDNLHRLRLRLAGFDGVSTYTAVIREQGNTAYFDATGLTGERWIGLYSTDTSLGVPANTLIGRARVNLGVGDAFGTYNTGILYAVGGIYPDKLQAGARFTNDVGSAVAAELALSTGLRKPFADAMSNSVLRQIVKGAHVFGVAEQSRQYMISQFNVEQFPATPLTRVLVDLKDVLTNTVVARFSYSVAAAPSFATFMADVPAVLRLDDFNLPPAPNTSRVYAMLKIDKAAIATWMVQAPLTFAAGGMHPDCQYTDEMTDDYLDRNHVHEVIRVGAGQTFTALRAAVESTYGEGVTIAGYRRGRAHYAGRKRVELVDDAAYQATYLDPPEYVEIAGQGRGRTFIVKENTNNNPLIEVPLDTKITDLTLYSDTGDGGSNVGQYCVHFDDINRRSRGGKTQNRKIRQSIKRCDLIGGPVQKTWLLGAGISSGGEMLFEDVRAWHESDLTGASGAPAAFGIHNTGPTKSVPAIPYSDKPARVRMRGCSSSDMTIVACYVQTVAASARCTLDLLGCDFWMVRQDVAIPLDAPAAAQPDLARDRFAWQITGRHDGAILQTDPLGLIVLTTTPGAAVSGDAAALIFGAIDNLGRGEKWIKDGSTTRSLGARLGDCSSVNKTLTIGAQTHTFTTDLTAVSNAIILAAINATLTTNPVSEADIQHEVYPDVGTKRRVKNSTGSTIAKGRAVKLTGLNTIALCGAGERPDGWTYRAIPNGSMGGIITGQRIATQYLDGAAASTGAWGLNASGQIDYAAAAKLGRTMGGVVAVW